MMVVIVDSKVYFYKALQSGRLSTEMFEIIIEELSKAYSQVPDRQPINAIVFVGDLGKSAYRLSLSPIYKGHRTYSKEQKEAQENYVGLIPNLSKTLGFIPMFIDGVEADDIAGILNSVLTANTKEQVLLLTADKDWSQLVLRFPNTYIKFANRQNLYLREDVQREEEVDDWFEFLLKKAIVSDKADNILGIHRVGVQGFKKFLQHLKDEHSEFDSLSVAQKYQLVVEESTYFENKKPHKSYLELNPEMTVAEAIRLNFQLGEIMTSTTHLTKEQKDAMGEYIETLRLSLKPSNINPVLVNLSFKAFNKFVEEHMPNELNDFGYPYTLPGWHKSTLVGILRGLL